MIYKFYRGDSNMIYRYFKEYPKDGRHQEIEKTFKNRTAAEIYYLNREKKFNKIAFKIEEQTLLVCCIEILEKTGTINALMIRHRYYGIIWIELL